VKCLLSICYVRYRAFIDDLGQLIAQDREFHLGSALTASIVLIDASEHACASMLSYVNSKT